MRHNRSVHNGQPVVMTHFEPLTNSSRLAPTTPVKDVAVRHRRCAVLDGLGSSVPVTPREPEARNALGRVLIIERLRICTSYQPT